MNFTGTLRGGLSVLVGRGAGENRSVTVVKELDLDGTGTDALAGEIGYRFAPMFAL